MKLFLHIGTEKTGSSYLQSLLAINRAQLESASIYFPKAGKREKDMRSGKISPGNGQDLYEGLSAQKYDVVKKILLEHFLTADKKDLEKVLISNELLVKTFAEEEVLTSFVHTARAIGYNKIKLLLIIRDPVDQALSLYKHRAKSGNVAPISEWIKNDYAYGNVLGSFFNIINKINTIDTEYRKYSSGSGSLESILFKDWLEIETPVKVLDKKVNPSLTLSELLMLRNLNLYNPDLVPLLYDKLLKIPKSLKAGESGLEGYYRSIISENLENYHEVWEECNKRLADGEYIEIPDSIEENAGSDINEKYVMTFSNDQIAAINSFIMDCLSFKINLKLIKIKVRKRLGQLKRTLTTILGIKR